MSRRSMLAFRAIVLAGSLMGHPATAHDFYSNLRNSRGEGCCGGQDCAPATPCLTADRQDGLVREGRCVAYPPENVLHLDSPDGLSHGCWHHDRWRCVILGAGA